MRRSQHILLGLLLFLLTAPIPGIFILRSWFTPTNDECLACLSNQSLHGVTLPEQKIGLSLKTWMDASFQRSVTKWTNENFAGREVAIRLFNQLLWSTFSKSYMYQEKLIEGQQGQLFEEQYLAHFSHRRPQLSGQTIERLAGDISQVTIRLHNIDVPFCVLFTPSKAITAPSTVPARYRINKTDHPHLRDYDLLKATLGAHGVPVVDGAELTRKLGGHIPLPPFAQTGTHWTDLAAFYTTEALLRKLDHLGGKPLAHLKLSPIEFTDKPRPPDDDLLRLLNLAFPSRYFSHYAYAKALRGPEINARQGRLVLIGDSFLHAVNRILEQGEVWERIDHYYYFSREHIRYPGHHSEPVNVDKTDWSSIFAAANAVVLEMNEAEVGSPYVQAFLKTALSTLSTLPSKQIPSR